MQKRGLQFDEKFNRRVVHLNNSDGSLQEFAGITISGWTADVKQQKKPYTYWDYEDEDVWTGKTIKCDMQLFVKNATCEDCTNCTRPMALSGMSCSQKIRSEAILLVRLGSPVPLLGLERTLEWTG